MLCLIAWLFAVSAVAKAVCDAAIACPSTSSSSAAVERDILAAAGGNLHSLHKGCHGYHLRAIFSAEGSFVGSSLALRQAQNIVGRLLSLPYSREMTPLQQGCLGFAAAACHAVCDLIIELMSDEQKAKLRDDSLLLHPSLFKHTPAHLLSQVRMTSCVCALVLLLDSLCVQMSEYSGPLFDLIEDWIEQQMGDIKRQIRSHGAHRRMDLVRQFLHAERSDEAKVHYRLPAAASSHDREHKDNPQARFSRGLLIAGDALQNAEIQAAFALARRKLGAPLNTLFVELPNFWLITDMAIEPEAAIFDDLAPLHDVLCMCADECHHVL